MALFGKRPKRQRMHRPFFLAFLLFFMGCLVFSVILNAGLFLYGICDEGRNMVHVGNSPASGESERSLPEEKHVNEEPTRPVDNRRRYLAPLHTYFDGGPNWAYSTFRMELRLALLQNRTIVATPFRVHDRLQRDIVHAMRTLDDTFDVDKIREIVPVVSIEEFYNDCKNEITPEIKWKPFEMILDKNMGNLDRFLKMQRVVGSIGRDYPLKAAVKDGAPQEKSKEFLEATWNTRCLALYFDEDIRWLKTWKDDELFAQVNRHLAWAPYIRDMVDGVYGKICNGRDFPVLHWRNRTGEGCLRNTPWQKKVCKAEDSMNLSILSQLLDLMVDSIVEYMHTQNYQCIYLAYPPYEQEFVNRLKAKFPYIFSLQNLLEMSPEINNYKNENYVLSIVEQEIAVRSKLFIGWRESSWTRLVYNMRYVLNRPNLPMPRIPKMPAVLQVIW